MELELGCEKRVTSSQRVGDGLQEGDSVQQALLGARLCGIAQVSRRCRPGELLFLLGDAWLQCGVME